MVRGARPATRFGRIVAVNVIAIPVVAWFAAVLIGLEPGYLAGLVVVAAAAAGPLGLKLADVARADLALAIGLVVVLEAANVVTIPLWSSLLVPGGLAVPLAEVARTLLIGIVLPLAVGFGLRAARPTWADRIGPPASTAASIGLVLVVAMVIVRDGVVLLEALRTGLVVAAALLVGVALVAGQLSGGPTRAGRSSATLVTAIRASAPALAVVGQLPGSTAEASAAVVIVGLVALVTGLVAALLMRRSADRAEPVTDEATDPRSLPVGSER